MSSFGNSPSLVTARGLAGGRGARLALAVGLPVSALLLFLSVRKLDVTSVTGALRAADLERLGPALGAIALMYWVQAARWQWIARRDAPLGTARLFEYVVAAVALNNVVPGRPGDILRAHWLGRAARTPRAKALGTVVLDRSADVLTLVAILALVFPLVGASEPGLRHLAGAVFGLTIGVVAAVAVGYRLRAPLLTRLGPRFPRAQLEGGRMVRTIRRSCGPLDLTVILLTSAAAWALWGLAAWLVAGSVGIALTPIQIAFVTAVVNLGVAIPSSPGFVGTYQWLCVSALAAFGVPRADAFAFSVLMHAVWFVPTSLAGIAALATKSIRRPQESAHIPDDAPTRRIHPATDPSVS